MIIGAQNFTRCMFSDNFLSGFKQYNLLTNHLRFYRKDSHELLEDRTVVSQPQRVISVNLSLNELRTLDRASLRPFSRLRSLDVSHNRLQRYI